MTKVATARTFRVGWTGAGVKGRAELDIQPGLITITPSRRTVTYARHFGLILQESIHAVTHTDQRVVHFHSRWTFPILGSRDHLVLGHGDQIVLAATRSNTTQVHNAIAEAGFVLDRRSTRFDIGEKLLRWPPALSAAIQEEMDRRRGWGAT